MRRIDPWLLIVILLVTTPAHGGDLIELPVRWCALDGSPAVDNVAGAPLNPYSGNPEPDTDAILWRRHERASDNITIPGADLTFRSGFTAAVRSNANFPILPDPCTPVGTNVCQSGDAAGRLCIPDGSNEDPSACGAGVTCSATNSCPAACSQGCVGELGDIAGTGRFCNGGPNPGMDCNSNAACGVGGVCARDLAEYDLAIADCTDAWDDLADEFDTPLLGPVAVNIGQFRNPDGTVDTLKGRATGSTIMATDICDMPPNNVTSATGGAIVARDNQNLSAFEQTNERMVAHEFGHDLYLWHGDGVDNDNDGAFDQVCDGDENTCATPRTYMSSSGCGGLTTAMTSDQRDVARAVGAVYTGATMDPPGVLEPSDGIGDQRGDSIFDVTVASVDIKSLGMVKNTRQDVTDVLINLRRPTPVEGIRSFGVFLDLDDDPKTGLTLGQMAEGADTPGMTEMTAQMAQHGDAPGFDLLALIAVQNRKVLPAQVYRVIEGRLRLCDDEAECRRIRTELVPVFGGDDDENREADDDPIHEADSVVVQMPTSLFGFDPTRVRAVAIALGEGAVDIAPDDPVRGATLRLVPPEFPVCFVEPGTVGPGDIARFNARKLQPGVMVKVILGDRELGSGTTNAEGTFTGEHQIPFEVRTGERLVTIGVAGQGMSADCPLTVVHRPRPQPRFEYAAKVVCGPRRDSKRLDFVRGLYATTVNVHNPNERAATVFLKFAMAIPERKIVPLRWDRLPYDGALAATCRKLQKELGTDTLVDGFLVAQSNVPLDVVTVTTSGSLHKKRVQQESVDVETVRERELLVRRPDLVVESIDPGSVVERCDGAVRCRIRAKVKIRNAGLGNAGAFTTRTTFASKPPRDVDQPSPGLTAGSSEEIEFIAPSGPSCFDPDCTVCAVVDFGGDVEETDATNNKLCVTILG